MILGVNEGVVAKLRRLLKIDHLELNTCAAHSFCLVGNQASYSVEPSKFSFDRQNSKDCLLSTVDSTKLVIREWIVNMERVMSNIYNYFGRSSHRRQCLKDWQNFLDMPQLMFKSIYAIRWSSIKDSIRPIFINIQPGKQNKTIVSWH